MSVKTLSVNAKGMVALNCPFCGDSSIKQANSLPNSNQPTRHQCKLFILWEDL
jgi:hypothetical protein